MEEREKAIPYLFSAHAQPHAEVIAGKPLKETFEYITQVNMWGSEESLSGPGSTKEATSTLRAELAALFKKRRIKSLLDIPCGDFNWMQEMDLTGIQYIGGDIVGELIRRNAMYSSETISFSVLDITSDPLPKSNLIMVRDCLVHLNEENVWKALRNMKASGSKFLLTTTFPATQSNRDIQNGDWRPINFELPPFSFPPPLEVIVENCTEANGSFLDKAMHMWRIKSLPL